MNLPLLFVFGQLLLCSICTAKSPLIAFNHEDDLRWIDISLQGSNQTQTPTIDLLDTEGGTLDQCYINLARREKQKQPPFMTWFRQVLRLLFWMYPPSEI